MTPDTDFSVVPYPGVPSQSFFMLFATSAALSSVSDAARTASFLRLASDANLSRKTINMNETPHQYHYILFSDK